MTPERYRQIDRIFQAAIELKPELRGAFLDEACSEDQKLRQEVESLITSDGGLSFIDEPAFEVAAPILASDEPAVAAGDRIDRYEVVSLLGSGGMGEVYLAHDEKLNRKIALKLLPAQFTQNQERLRRFEQEARAASALNHPNILTIYELGEADGQQFIATEFVEGETLRERMRRGPLSLRESLDIAIQVCSALAAAHKTGIVHRDIKPENIMLRPDGYVKVLDFGLAKLTEQYEPTAEIRTVAKVDVSSGLLMGTVKYMSPEQARGQSVDARSDNFSLGVVLYEMLTGHLPFNGEAPSELIKSIRNDQPRPLADYLPNAPEELQLMVGQALANDKSERYQAADLLVALKTVRQQVEVGAGPRNSLQQAETYANARGIRGQSTTSTGQHSVSGNKLKTIVSLVTIMLVTGAVVLSAYLHARNTEAAIESIAVLPFENQGHDPDRDYLSDGVTESIIDSLTRLPNLKVIARSSVFRYKGKAADPLVVGKELGVRAVLTGRIMQHGDDITVSTELIDVRDNKELWGEQYDEKISNLLSLQREIATKITANLRLKLSSVERNRVTKPHTENPEAYQLYLKGRYFWNKRNEEGMRKAIEQFRQAIDLDPTYALAYAGLADTYAILGSAYYDPLPPKADMPKAREAALRALELDDTLAEAHTAMAFVLGWYDWDWAGAERELKRAIELQPNYATAHHRYAWYLMAMGRLDEALPEMRRAQECDPLSLIIGTNVGTVLYCQRHYDEALGQFQKISEMDPNFYKTHVWPGMAYLEKGEFPKAIAEFEHEKAPWEESVWMLGMTYARMGRKSEARKILKGLQELAKQRYVSPSAFILIHTGLGEKDEAFAWLDKACEERDFDLCLLKVDPKLDSLRTDPRFARVLQRVGLAQ